MGGVPKRVHLVEKKTISSVAIFLFFQKKGKRIYGNPFAVIGTENNTRFERVFAEIKVNNNI